MTQSNQRVFGLDFLRALAIISVLATHGRVLLPVYLANQSFWPRFGTLGVELFFVLSGFLIGTIIIKHGHDLRQFATLKEFWFRRWMRTLPNYWLFLVILLIIHLINARPFPNLFPFLTFTQNLITHAKGPLFYPESWSLAVEECFYLVFPFGIFLLIQKVKSFDKAFLTLLIFFLITPLILRFVQYATYNPDWDAGFRKLVLLRLDAIMFGVGAAWIKHSSPHFWREASVWIAIVGTLMFVSGVMYLGTNDFLDKTLFFTWINLSIAMMIPLADRWRISRETWFSQSVRSVSLWSYSLYLCNLTVVEYIRPIEDLIMSKTGWIWPAYMTVWLGYFAVCMVISGLIFHFFEKPITDLRDQPSFPLRQWFVASPKPEIATAPEPIP